MNKIYIKIFAIIVLLSSCEKSTDKKKETIGNFNEKFVDSLIPIPEKHYAVLYVKIKGNSNDTVRLNLSSSKSEDPNKNYYFTGDFEKEIRLDYYGGSNKYITFDPYKATDGKVELIYML